MTRAPEPILNTLWAAGALDPEVLAAEPVNFKILSTSRVELRSTDSRRRLSLHGQSPIFPRRTVIEAFGSW